MTTGSALAGLSEPKLRAWLLARMREQHVDPPVDRNRLESPDDYPRILHGESSDARFRARLEKATLTALREVATSDLQAGPDAQAARHLAALADGLQLKAAVPVLKDIASRGTFGGLPDGIDPETEEMVLLALASLQPPNSLWSKWSALWKLDVPRLWPIATVGLRFSAPEHALEILPEAVERATKHPDFPLGEVLWAYATDERLTNINIADALAGLSPTAKDRCRAALRVLGAEEAELDAWLPTAPANDLHYPEWARISSITRCPRITEALACR